MPVYRGAGGAGDATNDATVTAVQAAATSAATSATAAADSATAAANSATGAATSATNASNSATTAAGQATTAAGHATDASTFATNSSLSATDSSDSATEAEGYASEAFDYKVAAASSASSASTSATNAAASSATATTAVNNALSLYGDAAALDAAVTAAQLAETNAETAETNAETAATTATNAASTATTQATNAAASAVAADVDATSASTDANEAQAAATAAQAAVSSATAIYGSIEDIQQAEANSEANRDAAAASATSASNSASASATSATNSATSASAAATSAAAASAVALGNEPVRHSIRPSLLLDFANTKTLDPRITFTRASTGTYYDGKTVAKAEENLLQQSETFENGFWSKQNASVTANTSTSPDGTTTADKIVEAATTTFHTVGKASISVSAGDHTASFYAKADGRNWAGLDFNNGSVGAAVFFDLVNGVVGTKDASLTASITSVGSGWYRCVATRNYPSAITTAQFTIFPASADNTGSYAGNGTSGILVWGAQLEQRSSVTAYTATTTAPITNYIPALQTAAAGVARFEHNPVTGESLGLEIEEQRTNLLLRSEEIDNAYWTKANASITANAVVAPDGNLTADSLVENTAAAGHNISSTAFTSGLTSAISYTFSVYVKPAGRSWAILEMGGALGGGYSWFDLSTGTLGTQTQLSGTSTITAVGNGWYRISITDTSTSTGSAATKCNVYATTGNNVISYTGDGFSGISVWGAQLEAGAFATSYIPTVASQVTRVADSASMTGTNFSSWYRADEGTVYAEYLLSNTTSGGRVYEANDGADNNRIFLSVGATANGFVGAAGVTQASFNPNALLSNKTALSYKTNDFAFSLNGATALTDTSGNIPVVNNFVIGSNRPSGGVGQIRGVTIKKIAYYPLRLTNAELQGVTTV